jgi:hypothetical protein
MAAPQNDIETEQHGALLAVKSVKPSPDTITSNALEFIYRGALTIPRN